MIDLAPDTEPAPPLAVLAHELRSPLATIVGMADAMSAETLGPLPTAYADYARSIREVGRHAIAVLDALLETGLQAIETAAAGQVVRDIVEAMRPRLAHKALQIDLEVCAAAAEAPAPRRMLSQVLFNLVDNAATFTGSGGRIHVALAIDGRRLRLEVSDSGPGAGAAERGAAGHGLGLAIVRGLCAAHGGDFRLETAPTGAVARAWLAPAGR